MDIFEPYVLCDTGNEYYFYDGTVCRYGELLKGLATLSRSSIKNVFYEMSLKQYNVSVLESAERVPLNEQDYIDHPVPTDEDIARYPIPELMGEEQLASYHLSDRSKISIGERNLKFLEVVIKNELSDIHRFLIDSEDGAVPDCFKNENEFEKDIRHFLTDKILTEEMSKKYIGKSQISYISKYAGNHLFKIYTNISLAQLIEIEISNVKRSQIVYKICDYCNELFIDGEGRGKARKYCEYEYAEGLCSANAQKFNEEYRPKVSLLRKRYYDKVRRYAENNEKILGLNEPLVVIFGRKFDKLVEQQLSYDEIKTEIDAWYSGIKKSKKKK